MPLMAQICTMSPVCSLSVNLVERETSPNGVALVDPNRSGKRGAYDLVELAANIEKADQFTKANAGSKLTVIAEQGRNLIKVRGSDTSSLIC